MLRDWTSYALGAVSFFVCSCLSAEAQTSSSSLEAYGELPLVTSAELSPDGVKVATIVNVDGRALLQVLSAAGESVAAAWIDDMKARGVSFYGNDHVILDVSETTRMMGFRGAWEYTTAFALSLSSGEFAQLLWRVDDLYPGQGGLGRIVGEADRTKRVLMPAFMGRRGAEPTYDLLSVELETGRARRYTRGTIDTNQWITGDGGRVIARTNFSDSENRYWIEVAKPGGGWTVIFDERNRERPMSIRGIMPDESGLVYVQDNAFDGGFDALMKLSLDGEISGPILGREDKEIGLVLTDRNEKVVGVRYSGLKPDYDFLDEQLQAAYVNLAEAFPGATIYLDSWTDDRATVLYRVFDNSLGDVWLTQDTTTNQLSVFAQARPKIPVGQLGQLFAIEYPAADGLTIPAIVTTPPGQTLADITDTAVIVVPHGGPASHDRFDFDWMAQFFASRGYLVLQPNFRGSTGYGTEFRDAGIGEFGGKMLSDIDDGVAALIQDGRVDPERMCIVGASYGGYAALASATFYPERYRCVVAISPVSDLNSMLNRERRESGQNHWVIDYWEELMADGRATPQKLDDISPAKHADRVRAPVLLIHGDDDTVVSITQSRTMERALKRHDKTVEFVRLKGEDHWLSVAETRLQTLEAMDAFLKRHMPPPALPPAPVETNEPS